MVDRIVSQIQTVDDIGLVFAYDPWDRDDLRNVTVSLINDQPTLRAWWVTGPVMNSESEGPLADGELLRSWIYTIHGIEGLAPAYDGDARGPGGDIVTLRDNAQGVSDALDADPHLGGACALSEPSTWPIQPEHRTFAGVVAVSYVKIAKRVMTFVSLEAVS